ncbi:uncharacterized protein A4U43_C05F13040 [Asparagus officinalis]|uniref:Uncharacterized protein n=1 Tax=Asparagus officinalis TaxID=4686 RepID=A0A5P1EVL9_ASPOF|nr:uncharacterized protein A4U43_C05F13040 [Asparagus officinalis]
MKEALLEGLVGLELMRCQHSWSWRWQWVSVDPINSYFWINFSLSPLDFKEDSDKISILKYGGVFPQERLFGTNIIGLRPSFVNEDMPVNEVNVIPNTFGNDLVKNDAPYPDGDAIFPS